MNSAVRQDLARPGARQSALPAPSSVADDTFPKLLRHHAQLRGHRPAIRHKDRGIWKTWSWADVYSKVRGLAASLKKLGVEHGSKIGIVGSNRPQLYWTITAAQMLRAAPIPIYADAVAAEMAYVLEHADVSLIVAQDQEQVDKILSIAEKLKVLEYVLYDEERGLDRYDDSRLRSIGRLIEAGEVELASSLDASAAMDAEIDAGQGADVSAILYTSGTTGLSKGVVLSAQGCIDAARDTVFFDGLTDRDEQLAYLPLAWAGDHYMNYAQGYVAGSCMACPENAETAQSDLREIGPSFYFAPPRVFEAQLSRIMIRMEDAGRLKRWMFRHFLDVAKRWGEKILDGRSAPLPARLHYALGDFFVYAPLKNTLGFSRIRVAYTAGEAIGADLFSFYRSLGINLKQLYGQTEAFLYVTCQSDGAVRSDAVGPAAPNVTIRVAEDGEVQFKSPGQFIAYYKDAARTAETLTPDGFVKTGDAGFFEPDGQLKIVDRAKDVGKLSDGSLFAPKYIENKLKFFPNIKEAVAVGADRGFVTAMLNIELESVGNWAERNNISYGSYQELAGHPAVYDMIEKHVDDVNRALSQETIMAKAQIRRFLILHKELDADDGELTRTQKVRRAFIAQRYGALVSALYDGSSEADISTEITYEDGRKGMISACVKFRDMQIYAST